MDRRVLESYIGDGRASISSNRELKLKGIHVYIGSSSSN